ncbi:MAG: 1-deoxy-D-xylulose-5-phosphate synthase [Clostridia bacterium]|nr:1-deoxy-D-xylulose-5-phosphate synthase [Clostridia bacterium]
MKTERFDGYKLLNQINSPDDLKALPAKELPMLAAEVRRYLSYRVRENGGHLASNLGVVELTMAIHRVFSTPKDHVIFDVGHQSYVHKLFTGRKEKFDTLRQPGGLSGFTKRRESEHDAFGAGHSSTAVSAAIGMAEADLLSGNDAYTVAVVGDGALTGGLAYEGLNNCRRNLKLVIIINENEMSISPNTGHLAEHLFRIRSSRKYLRAKAFTAHTLSRLPLIGRPIYRFLRWIKKRIKHLVYRENLFEHMGIRYHGPIDGNDIEGLIASLEYAKKLSSSVILHVKTQKGKGDAEAEANPDLYHGLPPRGEKRSGETFSTSFGDALCRLAAEDERICAITAAMSHGTGLEPFRAQYPKRFFDVGIAEGHAVTFAAGLAAGGKRPVVALYSTFLQRAYDNLVHDVALQGLPVIFALDRAGFNAADGATHHGVFDVSLLSAIPDVRIFTPVTSVGIAASLRAAKETDGVTAIRYPCGAEQPALLAAFYPDGQDELAAPAVRVFDSASCPQVTVVTHGRIAAEALRTAAALLESGIAVRVLLAEYIAPYAALAREVEPLLAGDAVLFYEEEIRVGGFGEGLAAALDEQGALFSRPTRILAAENAFATPRAGESVWQAAGVDAAALSVAVLELIKTSKKET